MLCAPFHKLRKLLTCDDCLMCQNCFSCVNWTRKSVAPFGEYCHIVARQGQSKVNFAKFWKKTYWSKLVENWQRIESINKITNALQFASVWASSFLAQSNNRVEPLAQRCARLATVAKLTKNARLLAKANWRFALHDGLAKNFENFLNFLQKNNWQIAQFPLL